ncbi:MAG: CoA transferase, partial [Chloroflexi bacterium]|nr:CoA transferase [Chloroflexota bacterium]
RVAGHAPELIAILDEAFAQRPAGEWVRLLNERDFYCARVQDYDEIARDPQVLANGYIAEVPRPDGEPLRMVTTPVQLGATPARIRGLAPEHGQHTEELLLEAGYTWEEIAALRREGAVGPQRDPEGNG